MPDLIKAINDALVVRNVTGITAAEIASIPAVAALREDKTRLDWLESRADGEEPALRLMLGERRGMITNFHDRRKAARAIIDALRKT